MIRNNQNGRRRGRGGARPPQQGGGPSGNYGNANGGGSRIDTRQRGNATQLLEKYKAMARDATQNGDRVQAEFYMQYADHYFRVLNEFRSRDPQPAPRPNYDDDDDGYGTSPGQNYAPPTSDRFDDEGDDDRGAERNAGNAERSNGNGSANGGAYRGNGERPRTDNYAGQNQRGDRFEGTPRYTRDAAGDDGREAPRRDEPPRRDENPADSQRRDGGQTWRADAPRRNGGDRDFARREASRDDRDGSRDAARNDPARPAAGADRGAPRGATGDDRASSAAPRDASPRDAAPAEPATMIGIPGPATLAPVAETPAEPGSGAAEAPAPRKRGRPRKVVVDTVDG